MTLNVGQSLVMILVVAATTFATRAVPFLIFPKGKRDSESGAVSWKGSYSGNHRNVGCISFEKYKSINNHWNAGIDCGRYRCVTTYMENNLLSIGAGTILYMFLIQAVFI